MHSLLINRNLKAVKTMKQMNFMLENIIFLKGDNFGWNFRKTLMKINQRQGFTSLRFYFCTKNIEINETKTQSFQCQLQNDNTQNQSHQTKYSTQEKLPSIDHTKIYQENSKRLKQASQKSSQKQFIFNQTYIKTNLLDTKYFYTDIIPIASHIIDHLITKIDQNNKNQCTLPVISLTHLHLLLYVYHLYIKEFTPLKQQLFTIIEHFFDSFPKDQMLSMEINLEIFVYLRKLIYSQFIHGNGMKLGELTEKYCRFLKSAYQRQLNELNNSLNTQESQKHSFTSKTIKKSKLLERYILSYPNLWISIFINQPQQINHHPSQIIQQDYHFFVGEFSNLFNEAIQHWINLQSSKSLPDPKPANFSYKKFLLTSFKQQQLNKCFNSLRLVIHGLFDILQIPKSLNEKNLQTHKKIHQLYDKKQYIEMVIKYYEGSLNILNYLPKDKLILGQELKFMRILILMKNLFGYQALRKIKNQQLTQHLDKFFANNQDQMINSTNAEIKRQINVLIGQLVYRLASNSWTDEDDVLGKYFQRVEVKIQNENKGKRNNMGEWFQ